VNAFIEDIISYISSNFELDKDIKSKVSVSDAYDENVKLKPPHIFIQEIDDSEAQQYSTFDGELISYVPVQISSYCQQMEIAGKMVTAKKASAIFADKIKAMFDTIESIKWNKNIKLMRRVGGTPSMPTQKGTTTYFSPTRYDFYLNYKYENLKEN
jgi:hypothetical protein